jgi:hypothetical protein
MRLVTVSTTVPVALCTTYCESGLVASQQAAYATPAAVATITLNAVAPRVRRRKSELFKMNSPGRMVATFLLFRRCQPLTMLQGGSNAIKQQRHRG